MEEQTQNLDKIALLEAEIKRLKRSVLSAMVLSFVLFASIFFGFSKMADVRWLAVHDRQGKMTGWWNDEGIQIVDEQGNPRIKLGMVGDQPSIQLFDADKVMKAQTYIYSDGSAYLMLWDKDGKGTRFPPADEPMP